MFWASDIIARYFPAGAIAWIAGITGANALLRGKNKK
jgi:hypothetical protein